VEDARAPDALVRALVPAAEDRIRRSFLQGIMNTSLPSTDLLRLQASWLASARSRMLRKAEVARRRHLLDLGCGPAAVTPELTRRGGGMVVAMDHDLPALSEIKNGIRVCGDACHLSFIDASFDLIFTQNVLLWLNNPEQVVSEAKRILTSHGVWILFEPDYGGLIEHPPELQTRDLWLEGLRKTGADPMIGRKLPDLLMKAKFRLQVELLPHLQLPHSARFDFLMGLPLSSQSLDQVREMKRKSEAMDPSHQVAHLPYFMILAEPA
jgi:SAM-dependent methyltransferase